MLNEHMILDKLKQFVSEDSIQRQSMKCSLTDLVISSNDSVIVMDWIADYLMSLCHAEQDHSFYTSVHNPELIADLIEIAHECLNTDVDLEPYVIPIARLLYINKKEREKTDSERYVQYRAAAMMDQCIALDSSLPPEAVRLMLLDYYIKDQPTEELTLSIWWRLAEKDIDISSHIRTLHTYLKNNESPTLTNNSILALWACIRKGYFDTPIPNSDNTYKVWLWHLVTSCVNNLKKKYEETTRLMALGCLLETASKYPETQCLILDCMDNWGIAEPKSPRSEFQRDLKELYSRCKDHSGTTCLPEGYVITKRGITISRSVNKG